MKFDSIWGEVAFGIVIILLALVIGGEALAAKVDVSWQHPTTRTNDAPLPIEEISHTVVQYSCPAGGEQVVVQAPANSTTLEVPYIGLCSFKAASVDITELSSEWSEVKQVMLKPDAPPRPPTWVEIIVAWLERVWRWFA